MRLRLHQWHVHNLSEPTGGRQLDVGFLVVRVAIASAIIFVLLLFLRFLWPLGLLAVIPAVGFLFVYLKWAIQQTRFTEDNMKEANFVRKGEETDKSEAVENLTVEKQSASIEQTESQVEARASTVTNLPSVKYCGFCGKLMPAAYTFCPVCGKAQIEEKTTTTEPIMVTTKRPHKPTKTVAIAIVLLFVLVASLLLLYVVDWGATLTPCTPITCGSQSGVQDGHELIMEAYSFPVGSPLTINFFNAGAVSENLANAQYFLCPQNSSGCVQGSINGSCNTAFVGVGVHCQAVISISETNLVSGVSCVLKVSTPDGGSFSYAIIYGDTA